MTDLSHRFCIPIDMPRPRGARLIEGFSPKLRRRIQFFDHATFAVWIGLEATPEVITMCERPTRIGKDKGAPVVDFWVRRADDEEFLFVPTGNAATPSLENSMGLRVDQAFHKAPFILASGHICHSQRPNCHHAGLLQLAKKCSKYDIAAVSHLLCDLVADSASVRFIAQTQNTESACGFPVFQGGTKLRIVRFIDTKVADLFSPTVSDKCRDGSRSSKTIRPTGAGSVRHQN